MRLLAPKRFPKTAWKRVVGERKVGGRRGNLVEVRHSLRLFPREALLRRATLGLYEGTALPFLEDGP